METDQQTYLDTIEAQDAANSILKDQLLQRDEVIDTVTKERDDALQKVKGYAEYNAIRSIIGKQRRHGRGKHFTKTFNKALQKEIATLNTSEKALLFTLSIFLGFESNFVVDANGQRICISQIGTLIGWGKNNTIKTINALAQKGFLEKLSVGRNTFIKLNENYFFRGKEK